MAGAAAVVSAATAAVSTATAAVSTATAVVSTASAAGASSAFLHYSSVNTATTAKLKSTFFFLLNYKRLIINSGQRYKFFNR